MKQDRLQEFKGYGYVTIGETEDDETIVAKRFDSGVVVIMAVHGQYVSQIRLNPEHMEKLSAL
jgi:hypothetical protein